MSELGLSTIELPDAPASEALASALSLALCGEPDGASIVERRAVAYRSTFPLEALTVRLPDGAEERMVFKDLSHGGTSDSVWEIKASFLHDPQREIETYRDVLGPDHLSAPRLRAAVCDPVRGRHWLFLESVDGDPLWQYGDIEVWQHAAAWLGELHARFYDRTGSLPDRLLRCDSFYYRRWLERARRFVRWPTESVAGRHDFAWLAARVEAAVEWLDLQPRTFLHGEFCPANILVERYPDGEIRIRPLDWEMAATGPGALDLAALTAGPWSEAEHEAMTEAYRSALPAVHRPSGSELRGELSRCRLLSAIQWLGWSEGWRPPPHQKHDWLKTALEVAADVPL